MKHIKLVNVHTKLWGSLDFHAERCLPVLQIKAELPDTSRGSYSCLHGTYHSHLLTFILVTLLTSYALPLRWNGLKKGTLKISEKSPLS